MTHAQRRSASARRDTPQIAIVGGGIGGLALALALASNGIRPVVFERRQDQGIADEGLFITLAPNGLNALRALDLDGVAIANGIVTTGLEIFNARGRRLGLVDYSAHGPAFGAPSVTIRRGGLGTLLLTAAKRAGADCRLGCPLLGLTEDDEGVTLTIPGGIERFDCVVGADGLRSSVRRLAMPELPGPVYNGLVGTGGIVDLPQIAPTGGLMRMTFGRSAFFGYIKAPDGPVHWFDSYPAPAQPGESDSPQRMAAALHARHRDDPLANAEITRAITALDREYPDYDMPSLSHWSTNRVVLMGDAAHAVKPHSGQGASMALEDALVLAGCLAAETTLWTAFRRFEALRRGRVAAAIALGRQGGQQKKAQSALALWLRDLILPRVLPLGQRAQERLFAFRADLSPLSPPQQ